MGRLLNEILLLSCMAAFVIGVCSRGRKPIRLGGGHWGVSNAPACGRADRGPLFYFLIVAKVSQGVDRGMRGAPSHADDTRRRQVVPSRSQRVTERH
jgi:hypothetical protein